MIVDLFMDIDVMEDLAPLHGVGEVLTHVFAPEQTNERRLAFCQERHRHHPERMVLWVDQNLREHDEAWAWSDLHDTDIELFAVDPETGVTPEQIQIMHKIIVSEFID